MKNLLSNLTPSIAKTLALNAFSASVALIANPAQAALLNVDASLPPFVSDQYSGSAVFGTSTSQWNYVTPTNSPLSLKDDTGTASGVTISLSGSSGISTSQSGTFAKLGIVSLGASSVNFSGLVSNGAYQLAIFNSMPTSYTVNGNTQSITGTNDWSSLVQGTNYALFQTTADSSGNLSFSIGGSESFSGLQLQSAPAAVPEPLTILGAATAAGLGAGFKRKLAKNQKAQKDA